MTFNTDIQKTEKEIAVLQKKLELLKEIKTHKSQPRMEAERSGEVHIVFYNKKTYYRIEYTDEYGYVVWWRREKEEDFWDNASRLVMVTDGETHRLLEGVWFNDVKKGKYDDVVDEPYKNVKAYWDEKDNPASYITDEVVNRLVKQYQYQKLYNRVRDQLGYSIDCCDEIVDLVEDWLPKEQSAEGSQNVNTELLVDGFNDCLRKIKEMLR
jgi:hypothetical protein